MMLLLLHTVMLSFETKHWLQIAFALVMLNFETKHWLQIVFPDKLDHFQIIWCKRITQIRMQVTCANCSAATDPQLRTTN